MDIDESYNKRVRIIGKPGETKGFMMEVQDYETGAIINNIYRVAIVLDPNRMNSADLQYYVTDKASGHLIKGENGPVSNTLTIADPEVDITAYADEVKRAE